MDLSKRSCEGVLITPVIVETDDGLIGFPKGARVQMRIHPDLMGFDQEEDLNLVKKVLSVLNAGSI